MSKKNSAEVIEPKSSSHPFKDIAAAQKHVNAFLNALSGKENFTIEVYATVNGVQCSCSVHGPKPVAPTPPQAQVKKK